MKIIEDQGMNMNNNNKKYNTLINIYLGTSFWSMKT